SSSAVSYSASLFTQSFFQSIGLSQLSHSYSHLFGFPICLSTLQLIHGFLPLNRSVIRSTSRISCFVIIRTIRKPCVYYISASTCPFNMSCRYNFGCHVPPAFRAFLEIVHYLFSLKHSS